MHPKTKRILRCKCRDEKILVRWWLIRHCRCFLLWWWENDQDERTGSGEASVPVVRRLVDLRESTLLMNFSRERQVVISSCSPSFQVNDGDVSDDQLWRWRSRLQRMTSALAKILQNPSCINPKLYFFPIALLVLEVSFQKTFFLLLCIIVQSRGIGHWLGRSWGTSVSVSRIGIGWYVKNSNLRD